ncbi:MAG TPA: hypothetical protein VFI22_02895, partial [Thermomicrobiales bacterium]|nr:hypothetical protein [Thermomicrobiales bacterium]
MDGARFAAWTRWASRRSRRQVVQAAAGDLAAPAAAAEAARHCPQGRIRCGRHCVDPQADRRHCGDCETACG